MIGSQVQQVWQKTGLAGEGRVNTRAIGSIGMLVVLLAVIFCSIASTESLAVPPGFEITEFADGLRGVRTLEFGPDGLLYAAISRDGRVVRLGPADASKPETVIDGLNRPYGLASGWLSAGGVHGCPVDVTVAPDGISSCRMMMAAVSSESAGLATVHD